MMKKDLNPSPQSEFQTATLPNGLRVIYHPLPTRVAYCGYVVCAGTRQRRLPTAAWLIL